MPYGIKTFFCIKTVHIHEKIIVIKIFYYIIQQNTPDSLYYPRNQIEYYQFWLQGVIQIQAALHVLSLMLQGDSYDHTTNGKHIFLKIKMCK